MRRDGRVTALSFHDIFAAVNSYDAMAKALAERNRRSRRMYTVMIPFAIAALIAAILLRVVLRSSMKEPAPPAGAARSW